MLFFFEESVKEFVISDKEEGQRLDKYLKRLLPGAAPSLLYRMLRKKNILLNGKKTEGKDKIQAGDTVKLFFSDESFEKLSAGERRFGDGRLNDGLSDAGSAVHGMSDAGIVKKPGADFPDEPEILYETEDILILNKPAGLLSQKAEKTDVSVNEWLRYNFPVEAGYKPSVLNRLDRNTSGIVLAAKNLRGARNGSEWIRNGSLKKRYECIVTGVPEKEISGSAFLCKDRQKNTVRIMEVKDPDIKDAEEIRFRYELLKNYGGYSLVSVDLITGKSHQIRAHLSWIKHPILGDPKYGDKNINLKWKKITGLDRQLLHAREIVLPGGKSVTAPYPKDMIKVMEEFDG